MKQSKNIIIFFEKVIADERLHPSHISVYVSLFQIWSSNRFVNPFRISREDVMKLGKIRSIATYHKCIRELCDSGFIAYSPSYNPYKGSLVEIIDVDSEKVRGNKIPRDSGISPEIVVPFSAPLFFDVEMYFNERDIPSCEADQFYSHHQSRNWKLSNGRPMKCWRSSARMWISEFKNVQNKKNNEEYRSENPDMATDR